MEPGQKVMVYEDPVTKTDEEGVATLIELYRRDCGDGLELWVVRFDDEPDRTFTRTVSIQ
jgi:hypothetical protein